MATFGVNLLDSNLELDVVESSSSVLTITDHSNYDDDTESGHFQTNFSEYKKITVTNPLGTEYVYSTLGDGDALINAPSTETLPIATYYTYTIDGVYDIVLEAVPTWDSSIAIYDEDDCVYYNEKLYISLQNSNFNKNPVTETTYWAEVDSADMPEKYRMEYHFAVKYNLVTYFQKSTYLAMCDIDSVSCVSSLCNNNYFVYASKLNMILEHISVLADNGEWDRVTSVINFGNTICNCIDSAV